MNVEKCACCHKSAYRLRNCFDGKAPRLLSAAEVSHLDLPSAGEHYVGINCHKTVRRQMARSQEADPDNGDDNAALNSMLLLHSGAGVPASDGTDAERTAPDNREGDVDGGHAEVGGSGQLLSPVKPTRQIRRQSRAISALSPLTSPSKAFVSIAKSKMLTHAHKKKMHEANYLKRKAEEALGQVISAGRLKRERRTVEETVIIGSGRCAATRRHAHLRGAVRLGRVPPQGPCGICGCSHLLEQTSAPLFEGHSVSFKAQCNPGGHHHTISNSEQNNLFKCNNVY
jgi:hypothetical protein